MFGARILLGVLVGFFVVPAIVADPTGSFNTAKDVITKIIEFGSAVGGFVIG